MLRVIGCLRDQHDPRLVALAALICILSCFTASTLLSRAQRTLGRSRLLWIGVAGFEFGCSVWSLHFIAMLAFMPHLRIAYDVGMTLGSIVVAIAGALLGFLIAAPGRRTPLRVLSGALMLTLAIAAMHYTGVEAMRLEGRFTLDPATVAWSFALCAALCIAAVAAMTKLESVWRQSLVTVLLSAAICSLHFVGMSALRIDLGLGSAVSGALLGSGALAWVVATMSISLILLSLALSIMDRMLCDRACEEKDRLRKLTAVSFEGLLIERDGVIIDANTRLCEFSGRSLPELIGTPVATLFAGSTSVDSEAASWTLEASDHFLRRANGPPMPVELLAQPVGIERNRAVAIAIRDLTARRDSEAALHRLAHHDAVTGLANRLLLDLRMRQAFESPQPVQRGAVLCLDLDRFKSVNDLLGHAAGDKLLVEVSLRLAAQLRQSDTLARLGGDEFVIMMPDATDMPACRSLAQRIVQCMSEPFVLDDQHVVVGVSIGIALYPQDGRCGEELLRCADIAMYRSKEDGRGTYRLFEAEMDAELQQRRALERDLRVAIEREQLQLYYQPLVSCETGAIEGYEALLRWYNPTRGFVSPADFIPVAEESGLILPLGQWVIRTACAAAAAWDAPLRIAVNLSPAQFKQIDLVASIVAILADTGLLATRLEIEVTEGVLINDPERAVSILSDLRALGIKVSLDDFGTGYSSLSYLRQFPLDKIKIDRSFIMDVGRDEKSAPIVRAVVALAHSLGLTVTAEGVETQGQLDLLQNQSCNQVQGYLLGRPAPLARHARNWAGEKSEPLVEPALA